MKKILNKLLNPITFSFSGDSGGSSPAPATTTTTTTPWGPTKSFWNKGTYDPKTGLYKLNKNANGPLGLLQQTSNFANQYKNLSPQEQQLLSDYQTTLGGRNVGIENMQGLGSNLQNDLTSGRYNTNFSDVGNTDYSNIDAATAEAARAEAATANAATAETTLSDLMNARSAQGALDPTSSLSQILKGDPTTNPYIAQMNQASINQAMQGYNDALQKTAQNVLPQIKQDAFASGQYGGSRQGIAEGIIGQQLGINARDLGQRAMDTGAQLYGGAFENAQQRMAAAAGDLNAQAAQNEQFNASSLNDMGQFNAANQQAINLANMQALNNMRQFNASSLNDIGQFNAGNQQAINLANMQALNNMGQFNASSLNDMSQFNAGNQQDVNLANMQALNNMGQFNATNALKNAQYNADLGLKNRSMSMEQAQNNLNNALQAYNTGKATYADVTSAQDALYGAQTDAEKTQMQRYLDMLNIQQGVYGGASGLGGSSTATTTGGGGSSNTMGNILGGLAGAGGLLSMFKG